ncbi:hypothetical protein, conserved [Plasmodium gonderi]|uniref:Uncharacterized protein n=1 Tax=Plasmodium gonderi TaxID=77519 RepID=A0A1Y1JAL7_PLAGO|nr:hypothetical protein, conserved [Plasmodium gonderi]GAW79559.1 hypothetical protein, conserved [Plasmodium gonderi]
MRLPTPVEKPKDLDTRSNDPERKKKKSRRADKMDDKTDDKRNNQKRDKQNAEVLNDKSRSNLSKCTTKKGNKTRFEEKYKKYYAANIDKSLLKSDINCVSYVYKNLNEQSTSKQVAKMALFRGGEEKVDAVFQMLELEKCQKKNEASGSTHTTGQCRNDRENISSHKNDDETIQSIIYSTFINTKLRQQQKYADASTIKPVKMKLTKTGKRGNNKTSSYVSNKPSYYYPQSSAVEPTPKSPKIDTYSKNLTATLTKKKVYTDECVQITETDEELKTLKNDGTFLYEKIISEKKNNKKVNHTQTSTHYEEEELNKFAKYITKQIINEAIIQITYEQNVKSMEEKKKVVLINHQQNIKTYNHLINYQENNLNIMLDQTEISRYLHIFNKINIFSKSRLIINTIVEKNIQQLKERNNEKSKKTQIEWDNQVIKHLLKNVIAFLATEKIVSYMTKELTENSFLNFCCFNKQHIDIMNANLSEHKISLYERRRMEAGHFNFVYSNDNVKINIPIRIKKHMNLENLLRIIKKHIKKKLSILSKDYDIDFLFIRDGANDIMSIRDLFSSNGNKFTICINKKEEKT